jgi:hypothetical protein
MRSLASLWCSLVFGSAVASAGTLQLLACPQVQFFTDPCAFVPPPMPGAGIGAPGVPEEPLFPKETVSPYMPPLMLKWLNDPTDANLDAYLDWQERKEQRTRAATHQYMDALRRRHGRSVDGPALPVPAP